MVPFDFRPRTRIVFGQGAIDRLGQLARGLGFKRTLVVADRGIAEAGYAATSAALLESAGIEVLTFQEFGHSPDTLMVEAGRDVAEPWNPDSVIAIGGGSSLDCAKAIDFLLANGGALGDYRGYGKAAQPLLPFIAVPTTAGSGSEAQSYAVVSDASTQTRLDVRRSFRRGAYRAARSRADLHAPAPRHRDGRVRRDRSRGRNGGVDAADGDVGHLLASRLAVAQRGVRAGPAAPGGCRGARRHAARLAFGRHGGRTVDARCGACLRRSVDRALQRQARPGTRDAPSPCGPLERRNRRRTICRSS